MDEFRDLVRRMRAKQKDYFRSRSPETLRECKDLERRVDEALESRVKTPSMFDQEDGR